jgi:hypothetical protein
MPSCLVACLHARTTSYAATCYQISLYCEEVLAHALVFLLAEEHAHVHITGQQQRHAQRHWQQQAQVEVLQATHSPRGCSMRRTAGSCRSSSGCKYTLRRTSPGGVAFDRACNEALGHGRRFSCVGCPDRGGRPRRHWAVLWALWTPCMGVRGPNSPPCYSHHTHPPSTHTRTAMAAGFATVTLAQATLGHTGWYNEDL